MEQLLFAQTSPAPGPLARQHSILFRTSSGQHVSVTTDHQSEDLSECSDCAAGGGVGNTRRIAIAKLVLAEATHNHAAQPLPISSARNCPKNTGAMGPLLSMLRHEKDSEKLRCTLDTLAFMVLDKTNRKAVTELDGLDAILRIFTRVSDITTLCSALEALCTLVKSEDTDKERLWQHPSKNAILLLLQRNQNPHYLIEVLSCLRKIAFRNGGGCPVCNGSAAAPQLLEPGLLLATAELLHPSISPEVITRALRLLRVCADSAVHDASSHNVWHACLYKAVPLMRDERLSEAVLSLMMSLSEHPAFKNLFFAAGAVPPLLGLMTHREKAIAINAACVISSLADAGLCRDQLCQEAAVVALLRTLQSDVHVEVNIAVIYTLTRLVSYKAAVGGVLRARGGVQLIPALMHRWDDGDAVLGALQLLELLGAPQQQAAPRATAAAAPAGAGATGSAPVAAPAGAAAGPAAAAAAGAIAAAAMVAGDKVPAGKAIAPVPAVPAIHTMQHGRHAACAASDATVFVQPPAVA